MRIPTRTALVVLACALPLSAAAQDYPAKNIRLIVPFGAGGGTDTAARLAQQYLEEALGVSLVVTNMDGAAGTIGTTEFSHADPDGYTLAFLPTGAAVMQPNLRSNLTYDNESFEPICMTVDDPLVISVAPDAPYADVAELMSAATSGNIAAGGNPPGSIPHTGTVVVQNAADVTFRYVPFDGSAAAAQAVLGGQIDVLVDNIGTTNRMGLKPLAILSDEAHYSIPDVPSFTGADGAPVEMSVWFGLFAPAGTPEDILDVLDAACTEATSKEAYQDQARTIGSTPSHMGREEFHPYFDAQFARYGELFEELGLKR